MSKRSKLLILRKIAIFYRNKSDCLIFEFWGIVNKDYSLGKPSKTLEKEELHVHLMNRKPPLQTALSTQIIIIIIMLLASKNISNFVSNNNRKSNIVVAKRNHFEMKSTRKCISKMFWLRELNWNNNDVIKNTLNAIYMRNKI